MAENRRGTSSLLGSSHLLPKCNKYKTTLGFNRPHALSSHTESSNSLTEKLSDSAQSTCLTDLPKKIARRGCCQGGRVISRFISRDRTGRTTLTRNVTNELLALTMTDSRSHSSLLSANLSSSFSRLLGTHVPELSSIQNVTFGWKLRSITSCCKRFKSGFRLAGLRADFRRSRGFCLTKTTYFW